VSNIGTILKNDWKEQRVNTVVADSKKTPTIHVEENNAVKKLLSQDSKFIHAENRNKVLMERIRYFQQQNCNVC